MQLANRLRSLLPRDATAACMYPAVRSGNLICIACHRTAVALPLTAAAAAAARSRRGGDGSFAPTVWGQEGGGGDLVKYILDFGFEHVATLQRR
jgi:hypothetical protein